MECFDVKSRIGFYFDQELRTDEMERVAAHIEQCPRCQLELSQLQEIETIVRSEIYEDPPADYWVKTPQTITHRLGLTKDQEPSLLARLMKFVERLLPTPGLRWGLVGGLAVAVLVVLSLNVFNLRRQETTVVQQPVSEESGEVTASVPEKGAPVESPESEPAVAAAKQKDASEAATDEPEAAQIISPQVVIETRDLALSEVPPKTVVTDRANYSDLVQQERRPIPASPEIISDLIARDADDIPAPDVNTLSLEQRVDSKHLDITNSTDGLSELESDYLETIKIVEESPTLEEKRNIWLSYVGRQSNFTYKTLGIYHLALVFYDIADLEYSRDKAREAIDFYSEEEETLRFQMGDEEYEARVSALELILLQ